MRAEKFTRLTPSLDLRTEVSIWNSTLTNQLRSSPLPATCDVAVIGAGVTGALLGEQLSAQGLHVVWLDRRAPGSGSTAASTAQIMWAMDMPLSTLSESVGEVEAARRWRRVHQAVVGLGRRVDALHYDVHKVVKPSLYLEGNSLSAEQLREEAKLRTKWGLPSRFLDGDSVAAQYGIAPRAAIVSDDDFEIDPLKLTHAMLLKACDKGATLTYPVDIEDVQSRGGMQRIFLGDGRVLDARHVILATGYESARQFLPAAFSNITTFVIATPPGFVDANLGKATIWEASDPYLYVRTTADGRLLAGGEDEALSVAATREARLAAVAPVLARKLEALLNGRPVTVDQQWAATFGVSPDGLPAIGRAPHAGNVWMAYGYGGNGIAFSALAAELISAEIAGRPDPLAASFSPQRFADEVEDDWCYSAFL